ncbi:MAG: hypothetical protein QXJ19_04220 [Candidatus Bathyarchaeia archaeon]|nr:hypothetical protein [Candidatus Bathyarchaeota archaeon]
MSLGVIETGLIIYGIITVYWTLLGTYMLVKTNVIGVKAAPLIILYSLSEWLVGRIMYIFFPEIPPHPILILSGILNAPQVILTTIYVYVNTGIIKIRWTRYLLLFSFYVGVNRLLTFIYRFSPLPEVLVLPVILSGWAGYPAWFYVYVKSNRVFTYKNASIIIALQILAWIVPVFMMYNLNQKYSLISLTQQILNYPITIITLIFLDRYRLRKVVEVSSSVR